MSEPRFIFLWSSLRFTLHDSVIGPLFRPGCWVDWLDLCLG